MAQLEEQNPLDYRQGGDTVDDFAQKYMKEITRIYQFLNNIREHNSSGTYQVDPQPYQFKAENGKLYIRNEQNTQWLYLFDVAYRMGQSDNASAAILTSDDVTTTAEALKLVKTNSDGEIDANITGNALHFGNKTADQYVTVDMVSDAGVAEKIVKTDAQNVAAIGISGSAAKLGGELPSHYIDVTQVENAGGNPSIIVRTNANGKLDVDITGNAEHFGNKTADQYVTTDMVSDAGVASKIVKTDVQNIAAINISGSAAKFNNKPSTDYVLQSEIATVEHGAVTHDANRLVKTNANGVLPVDILGNAGKMAGVNVEVNHLQDGQVFTYRAASNSWRNEDKGVVGAGKALAVYDGQNLLFEYSGDNPQTLDIKQTETATAISNVDAKTGKDSTGRVIDSTYIRDISINGTTVTVTKGDGTTSTLTTQDNNTTYGAATSSTFGLVKTGSNITNSNGTISLTSSNVTSALGYTPPTTNTTYGAATSSTLGLVKTGSNITNSNGTISLTSGNVTNALGYTPPTTNTTYSTGTASYSGTTKLYTGVGDNTDGTMTQKAIKAIVGTGGGIVAASLTANGYVKFANGLILQWGVVSSSESGIKEYSYPIAFPTACHAIVMARTRATASMGSNGEAIFPYKSSASKFEVWVYTSNSYPLNWIAVGN